MHCQPRSTILGKGHLDKYLRPFIRDADSQDQLIDDIRDIPGLAGGGADQAGVDEVLGKVNEPALEAQYKAQRAKRES